MHGEGVAAGTADDERRSVLGRRRRQRVELHNGDRGSPPVSGVGTVAAGSPWRFGDGVTASCNGRSVRGSRRRRDTNNRSRRRQLGSVMGWERCVRVAHLGRRTGMLPRTEARVPRVRWSGSAVSTVLRSWFGRPSEASGIRHAPARMARIQSLATIRIDKSCRSLAQVACRSPCRGGIHVRRVSLTRRS